MSIVKNTVNNSNYAITKFQSELKTFLRRCFCSGLLRHCLHYTRASGRGKKYVPVHKKPFEGFFFLTVSLLETFKLISETIVLHVFDFYQQNLLQTSPPKIY